MSIEELRNQHISFIQSIEQSIREFDDAVSRLKQIDSDSNKRIIDLNDRIGELNKSINKRENISNYELEIRFNRINSNSFAPSDNITISCYIEMLRSFIGMLYEQNRWKKILSTIENHPKFNKFINSSPTSLSESSFHLADLFSYSIDAINDLIPVGFLQNKKLNKEQSSLYYLYTKYKEMYSNNDVFESTRQYYLNCLDDAQAQKVAWEAWKNEELHRIQSEIAFIEEQRNFNESVESLRNRQLRKLQYQFSPVEMEYRVKYFEMLGDSGNSTALNSSSIKLSNVTNELVLGISKKPLAIKKVNLETDIYMNEILSTYNGVFGRTPNTDSITYSYPILRNLNTESLSGYVNIAGENSWASRISYFLYAKLKRQNPWPLQIMCGGDGAKRMDLLIHEGAVVVDDMRTLSHDLYNILLKREKLLQGKSFFSYNTQHVFENEELLSTIIAFLHDKNEADFQNCSEYINTIISRGVNSGIHLIYFSNNAMAFSAGLNWRVTNNGIVSEDDSVVVNVPLIASKSELNDIVNIYGFGSNYVIEDVILSPDIKSPKNHLESEKIICQIGVDSEKSRVCIELSANHNAIYISGKSYSGKSNVIHLILNQLLHCAAGSIELYLIDMQLGGFEYIDHVNNKNNNIKMMVFDTDDQAVFPVLIILMKEMRHLADLFRNNYVHDWKEYEERTGTIVCKRVLIIDGIDQLPNNAIDMIMQLICNGARYNIQIIIAGDMVNRFEEVCTDIIFLGKNSSGGIYPTDWRGFGTIDSNGKKKTVQIYHCSRNMNECYSDNKQMQIICKDSANNPNSLMSMFLKNDVADIKNRYRLGCMDLGYLIDSESRFACSDFLNLKGKQNLLVMGGNRSKVISLFVYMILDVLIEGISENEKPRIYLINPTNRELIELANELNNLIDIIVVSEFLDFKENFMDRRTFVFIDDFNANPALTFHPNNDSLYQINPEGDFIKKCIFSNNVHVIVWCDHPSNMHPFFMSGNSITGFIRLFDFQLVLKMEQKLFDLSNSEIVKDSKELTDSTGWIINNERRHLISFYRILGDYMIGELKTLIKKQYEVVNNE